MNTWQTKPIGEVFRVVNGGTPKTGISTYWDGDHHWITPAEMGGLPSPYLSSSRRTLTDEGLRVGADLVPPHSIIMSTRAPIGHLVINQVPMAFNQGCKGLVPSAEIDAKYGYYFFLGNIPLLESLGTGTTFKELSGGKLKGVSIHFPPKSEQRRIVAILDEAFEAIAIAKVNAEKNLRNGRELYESQLERVLSRRPSELRHLKLGELCQVKTGKKDVNQGNPEGQFPFFTCAAEHTYSDSYSFDAEALLIAGNGNVGQVSYYSGKFEAYQRTYVLLGFEGVTAKYMFRVLDKRLSVTVSKQKLGNTMPYIKIGMLTDFIVPVPSLEEQRRIVDELELLGKEIERFESLCTAKIDALTRLKASLFHRAFTGQLTAKTTDQQLAEVA